MLLVRVAVLPFRIAFRTTGVATKVGYRTGRLLGYRRLVVFGAGVVVGLMIAPMAGAALRAKLRELAAGARLPSDPELGDQVRFELSHSPRTWHLPQPEVDVQDGRVVLSGSVPHATAAADLERTATGVPGVTAVENLLTVAGSNGQN
jgi:BON domain